MAGITHSVVAVGVESGDPVSVLAWNAEHNVPDGALTQAKVAGLVAALAALQPLHTLLTAIAALADDGVITRVGAGAAVRAIGVATGSAIPDRDDADSRYSQLGHTHTTGDLSGALGGAYAPGSATVATGRFAILSKRLQLTTTERLTLAGTARLRIT